MHGEERLKETHFRIGPAIKPPGCSKHGVFGMGLKDAIAVLMRNDCCVTFHSGNTCFSFDIRASALEGSNPSMKDMIFRLKKFNPVTFNGTKVTIQATNSDSKLQKAHQQPAIPWGIFRLPATSTTPLSVGSGSDGTVLVGDVRPSDTNSVAIMRIN
jgi:hypothetical protein